MRPILFLAVGFTLAVAVALAILLIELPEVKGQPPGKGQQRTAASVEMPANLTLIELQVGLSDTRQQAWEGSIRVSDGRAIGIEIVRASRDSKAEKTTFSVRAQRAQAAAKKKTTKKKAATETGLTLVPAILNGILDAPPSAELLVATNRGEFAVRLSDLADSRARTFLAGSVSVRRLEAAVRLTARNVEDDFPAVATDDSGAAWLAYVEYVPGRPIDMDQARSRNFDSLEPTTNGDRIVLRRLDKNSWSAAIEVTAGRRNVHRPTVAVDGNGFVVVAWAEQFDGDWEIFYRRYQPGSSSGAGQWGEVVRVTDSPGSDFHVVSAKDAHGAVWLAWQARRKDNFDVLAKVLSPNHAFSSPQLISNSDANDWSPAIAADAKGNVYVAWDTYAAGNYDVRMRIIGEKPRAIPIADSPRFEARASLTCDKRNRVWIAYEIGDEQWGKDFATSQFDRIGLAGNPGFALYINRTVELKCLDGEQLMAPATPIAAAMKESQKRNKSLPRLAVDDSGALWVLLRHHPSDNGAGETWHSYALRYSGDAWSESRHLAYSANLLDNRPAVAPYGGGILAAYSGDGRTNTTNRDQADVFAAVLTAAGGSAPKLQPDQPSIEPAVASVHDDETADVERMRSVHVDYGGKRLRLLRGEFHRHTEYTAHRDGDGTLEDSWRYALDAGRLDWMGNGDHLNGYGHEYMWWLVQKSTDLFQNPPHFVAAHTYERSVVYPSGHRNVILPRRGVRPLPVLDGNELRFGTLEAGAPDVKMLYAYLKRFGGICAIHTSATSMGTDWRDNDPDVEPIVEIYQGHRHNYEQSGAPRAPTAPTNIGGFEAAGFVSNALAKNYRLGFQASSDHISTHMSYAVVLAEEASRQGIIDAFKARHCYAATDNIVLLVRSGAHLMGDAFASTTPPKLEIEVHGPRPIARIHVVRDNEYVYSSEPKTRDVKLQYTDMAAKAGATSFYYVRVEQSDGNLAWASPMWIAYKPAN